MLGLSIASGAVISGVLIWWHPVDSASALVLPGITSVVLSLGHVVAVAVLMREDRPPEVGSRARATQSIRQAPGIIRSGISMLRHNRVLAGLVLVEVSWSAAMVVFETFMPVRLSEIVASQAQAAAVMGPVSAVGWGVYALGAAGAGLLSARIGVVRTAMVTRSLNSLGALVMGLVYGPVALVAAYLVTYSLHGAAGPMHSTLLHRVAHARNRATVLSINSMAAFLTFSVVAILGGLLAVRASTAVAMVTIGAVSLLGVAFYLPALRAERARTT